ncbi:M10 family metallopeptidase [Croceicoccus mobilis]|nr:M10 family metallopeptidase [Croceicoccus mobilis]
MAKKTMEIYGDPLGHDHGAEIAAQIGIGDAVSDAAGEDDPLDFNLDNYAGLGLTYRGKPIYDLDGVVDQIDTGRAQKVTANGVITYTFLKEDHDLIGIYNNPNYGFSAGYGVSAFSAEQMEAARASIDLWDDLLDVTFVEKNGLGADIQFANSWDPAQAYAYYPSEQGGYKYLGDVFVADPKTYYADDGSVLFRGNYSNGDLSLGGYGATTIVHELGHSLGLSHPGNYNYDPDLPLSYENYAEYAQDSEQYTIMSYWDAAQTGARIVNWGTFFFNNPQTPLMHDIYVAQEKYGADPTTRTDDTTYGFNATAGKDVFDFSVNEHPYLSIYDAGGIDTLDFSGFEAGSVINLNDGEFSSAGQGNITTADTAEALQSLNDAVEEAYGFVDFYDPIPQATIDAVMGSYMQRNMVDIYYDWGHAGVYATQYENISIAYGTEIENAIGTEYRDLIVANELDNVLTGNGGADVFIFQDGGNDTITDFVSGDDLIDLSALATADTTLNLGEGFLEADFDGDGNVDLTITFDNGEQLVAADVYLG